MKTIILATFFSLIFLPSYSLADSEESCGDLVYIYFDEDAQQNEESREPITNCSKPFTSLFYGDSTYTEDQTPVQVVLDDQEVLPGGQIDINGELSRLTFPDGREGYDFSLYKKVGPDYYHVVISSIGLGGYEDSAVVALENKYYFSVLGLKVNYSAFFRAFAWLKNILSYEYHHVNNFENNFAAYTTELDPASEYYFVINAPLMVTKKSIKDLFIYTALAAPNNYVLKFFTSGTPPETEEVLPETVFEVDEEYQLEQMSESARAAVAQKAADLATELVADEDNRAEYLWNGKGWDYGLGEFVPPTKILSGYRAYANDSEDKLGLDCSGVITWAFNRAFDPKLRTVDNFIKYVSSLQQFAGPQSDPV